MASTKQTLKLLLVFSLFFCYNLNHAIVTVVAFGLNSPQQSSKSGYVEESKNIVERDSALEAARLGGRGGGENGNVVQTGGGMVPVYAAAGEAKNKHSKKAHHKGGCTNCKAMEPPLLVLLLFLTFAASSLL
ncbi:PREDICTED: uncharacterized protein LOC104824206 isoform X2 [Tarenaya hassleriana]|uniref:uncharacterized protein LOC104824206 isoform X2 n=1 Tax=Tarenaya hassleriana TaxID=28532 RepID=UPI00053C114D|nr:PREDICTED: uncharacterized protein LOC104824206 isoform X2 [Tarenaya hassleriana]